MTFTQYLNYINALVASYITPNVQLVANAISPMVYGLLSLYVILWGISYLRGEMREPITETATRFVKIALICGIGLKLASYNELVIDTFVNGPEDLARMLAGSSDNSTTASSMDTIFAAGFAVAKGFMDKAGLLSGDLGFYVIGFCVLLVTICVTVYSFALILLSKIMLCILITLGPIFIISLLFQASAGYFSAWIHKMTNYALLGILVIVINKLLITLFERAAVTAVSSTQIDQVMPVIITGILSVIALAQLTTVAAGLAGGLSMSTQGMGSLGLSMMTSAPGRAASLARMGMNQLPKPTPPKPAPPLPRKLPREPSPSAYENRNNQIGPG
jgi:type IV secretion system protein VirB6